MEPESENMTQFENSSSSTKLIYIVEAPSLSIQSIFYLVFGGIGCFGNGYVLIVFLRSRNLRNKKINIFLINQSVVDFLCCIVLMITYKDKVSLVHYIIVFKVILYS